MAAAGARRIHARLSHRRAPQRKISISDLTSLTWGFTV
jgi:hypothetical protein